jgi:hypothetical protein
MEVGMNEELVGGQCKRGSDIVTGIYLHFQSEYFLAQA